jgi:LysR family transcriptional regulator, chromosome initiation inhibitor
MDLQLDQLRALAAVVAGQTFERAAADLGVTPSAISQRIKALETAVGRVLVQRSKPVRPTASGQVLLRLAREIELLTAQARQELGDEGGAAAGLPIVVNADSLATWVLPALAPLTDRIPLLIHREDQAHSTELLRDGSAMAAVTSTSVAVQGCSVRPLGLMRYRPVAAPDFVRRWIEGGPGLAQAPMLVFDEKDDLQDRYLRTRLRRAADPPRHRIPASADFVAAVRLGIGWAMVPDLQSADDLAAGRLQLLDRRVLDVPLFWQQWKLRSSRLDEVADVLVTAARQVLIRSAASVHAR